MIPVNSILNILVDQKIYSLNMLYQLQVYDVL